MNSPRRIARRVIAFTVALSVVLLALELAFVLPGVVWEPSFADNRFAPEHIVGFYAFVGAASCALIVAVAALLRRALDRESADG